MNGGLDGFPSLSRMKQLYRERTGQELKLDGVVQAFVPAPAPARLDRVLNRAAAAYRHAELTIATGRRLGDRLELTLPLAPRTKKNGRKGGFGGIKQGPAYTAYRDAIIGAVLPLKQLLRLPLPEQPYNIAVTYFVDSHGKSADKCGLDQGLYDALENAGVVTDDWYFRTDDGTRIVAGDPSPRVELVITPIQEGQHGE